MSYSYRKTPIIEIKSSFVQAAKLRLYIKREDLNHPEIAGNKWWKLKYNIKEAQRLKHHTLLTFGGAYSNHIYATAASAFENDFKSIGVIRGEEVRPLNSTLAFAHSKKMKLHYVSRQEYNRKTESDFFNNLRQEFGDFYLIPEGGTNSLAVRGCEEFATTLLSEIDFDYLCLPVGTGGTIAGMIKGIGNKKRVVGFSSLKGGSFLEDDVKKYLNESINLNNWEIQTEYHYGGYGKSSAIVDAFIIQQKELYDLPLDKIYTAKMMLGIYEEIKKGKFKPGSVILAIHTGGLQNNYF